jgi:TRAP-type C4-dicarboxylate transport system permease small subunit
MLVEKLPLRFKRFWRAGISLIIALISATVCYVGILIVQSSYANWTVIDDFLRTPKWIILSPIPISAFFLAIQAFRDMAGELAATKSETKEETA